MKTKLLTLCFNLFLAFLCSTQSLANSTEECIFAGFAGDIMEGNINELGVTSRTIALSSLGAIVRFNPEDHLISASNLPEFLQRQIFKAIVSVTQESFENLDEAIQNTDDAFVNIYNLTHEKGSEYVFVEFGRGNSNSFGAIFPKDSLDIVATNYDGDVGCSK